MTTIRDIARQANVSPSTVSLVLNGRGNISPLTEKRVQEAIERMNYRPKRPGRPSSEAKGRIETPVRNLAVVYAQRVVFTGAVCTLAHEWINAIRSEAVAGQHHLSLFAGVSHVKHDFMYQGVLDAGQIDGVILIGVMEDDGYLQYTLDAGIPMVVLNRRPKYNEFSYVGMDNYGAGLHVMKYLTARNHRRIAVIASAATGDWVMQLRDGAQAGLNACGLSAAYFHALAENSDERAIRNVCKAVCDAGATAVYVLGDNLAIQCLDIWTEMNVSIPGDLSVIGYDNVGPMAQCGLRPSSVGYDKQQIGTKAVEILLELVDAKTQMMSRSHIVKTYVVEHHTTGPAPE